MNPEFSVVWPLGKHVADSRDAAAGLTTLNGMTIAFVWDHMFRGDEMFELLEAELGELYDDVRFVQHDAFGNVHGPDERAVVQALPQKMQSLEVDAAIVAVGA